MKHKITLAAAFLLGSVAMAIFLGVGIVESDEAEAEEIELVEVVEVPRISHRQEVWIYALEWCESRGETGAVNPKDLDGTPSYYSFQFKPSTFRYYGEMYGVIEKGKTDAQIFELVKDYEMQKQVVTEMVIDRKNIKWNIQFPGCTRKLGTPPAY